MTVKYIDHEITGSTANYSIDDRDGSGTDGSAYETFSDYWAAKANDDTIIFREGAYTEATPRTITNTGITIENYTGESMTLTYTPDNVFLTVNQTITINAGVGGGQLEFIAQATGTINAFLRPNSAVGSTVNDLIITAEAGSYCLRMNDPTDDGNTFNRCQFRQGTGNTVLGVDTGTSGAVGALTFNYCIFEGKTSIIRDMAIAYNNCILKASKLYNDSQRTIDLNSANATVTLNNCIAFGAGVGGVDTQENFRQQAGTFTINGGIVNGNILDAQVLLSGTFSGTAIDTPPSSTLLAANKNKVVRFSGYGADKFIFTGALTDSQPADPIVDAGKGSDDYVAMLAPEGLKMSWFPDDAHLIATQTNKQPQYIEWVGAGQEMSLRNYSGDNQTVVSPITVAYTGAASGGAQVVISNSGALFELQEDTGSGFATVSGGSFNTSRSNAGVGVIGKDTTGLEDSISAVASGDWACVLVTAKWDDTYSYTLADDIIPMTGSADDIPFDNTVGGRRWTEEVDMCISSIEAVIGVGQIKTYNTLGVGVPANLKTTLTNNDLTIAAGREQIVYTVDYPIAGRTDIQLLQASLGDTLTLLGDLSESQVRQAARSLATTGLFLGIHSVHLMGHLTSGTLVTAEVYGWFLNELNLAGVDIMTLYDAGVWIDANRATVTDVDPATGVQKSGSAGIGIGTKLWGTDPRPHGIDGEPYPDTDIDLGPSQSTVSANHPENL